MRRRYLMHHMCTCARTDGATVTRQLASTSSSPSTRHAPLGLPPLRASGNRHTAPFSHAALKNAATRSSSPEPLTSASQAGTGSSRTGPSVVAARTSARRATAAASAPTLLAYRTAASPSAGRACARTGHDGGGAAHCDAVHSLDDVVREQRF